MPFLRGKRRKHIFRTSRFSLRFRKSTEASFCSRNRVELLENGPRFFDDLIGRIGAAKDYILAEFYIVRDDCAGRRFAGSLIQAARRGVSVSLLYDYIGCFDTPASFFRTLQKEGIWCLPFNPPPFRRGLVWFDKRDHRKLAVIDGDVAFVGGLNIGDEYAGYGGKSPWRDLGLRLEGPSVSELRRFFLENWIAEGGEEPPLPEPGISELAGEADVILISGGPHHLRPYIRSAYRMAIASASETVTVLNPYFIPGPRVIRSLLRAARRGVRVRLVLPSVSDVPLVRIVSRGYFLPLLREGIEIYEREGAFLHAKVMLIDDCWAILGSANLDYRSFHRNYELNVIVDSVDFGAQLAKMVEGDLAHSRRLTIETHESRSWRDRAMEFVFSPISRFL
jgi:cardiolipin synthase A/B